MHLPLAYLLLNEENSDIIHEFDRENLNLNILTGLKALSRSSENQNLVIACTEINTVIPVFTQLGLDKSWNIDAIAESILLSNSVNIKALKYTEEEMRAQAEAEQAAQQAQQMQQMQSMGASQGAGQLAGQESAIDALQSARGI